MVKVFTDEIPRVPISAFTDLDLDPREYQVSAQDPSLISQLQDTNIFESRSVHRCL